LLVVATAPRTKSSVEEMAIAEELIATTKYKIDEAQNIMKNNYNKNNNDNNNNNR